jgi:hypothetical protein
VIRRAELQLSLQFADPTLRPLLPRHQVQRWLCAALDAPASVPRLAVTWAWPTATPWATKLAPVRPAGTVTVAGT